MSTPAALSGAVASRAAPSVSSENTSPSWISGASRGQATANTSRPASSVLQRVLIGVGADGRLGRQKSHPPLARGLHRGPGPGHDDADDGSGKGGLQLGQGGGRGRVARDDDQLDVHADEPGRGRKSQTADLRQRLGPVREVAGVAQVDEVLVRKVDQALVEYGQARLPRNRRRLWLSGRGCELFTFGHGQAILPNARTGPAWRLRSPSATADL